ncbi:Hypothetical protein PHPALM_19985 [Phytophthora palmivora]|uniref:Uncharacterized protein n=1 Tax=Phytophthora palmivora TaxID=4796 RepID=A0A2P4XFZ5_9STRA|nr:Hypothetical protein PHPALM_19985 [Phytophthora palmivora]
MIKKRTSDCEGYCSALGRFKLAGPGDGVPGPYKATSSHGNRVFDHVKAANTLYFQRRSEEKLLLETCVRGDEVQAAKAFFDEGADFCGVSVEWVAEMKWNQHMKDLGSLEVIYANGDTESIRNQTIELTVFVYGIPGYTSDFQLCHIPNQCELMLGAPWKRTRKPAID